MPSAANHRPILIVDDEPHIRLTLTEALAVLDHPTETAADGYEALDKLDRHNPALLLLDLKMPGLDGIEVLREVHHRRPDIPVIILTAHGDVESAVSAIRMGAVSFLQKPVSLEAIRTLVAETLDPKTQAAQTAAAYDAYLEKARENITTHHLIAALTQARRALGLDASRPEAFNLIGVVQQLQMNVPEAQKYYRSALALDDTFAAARNNLENISGFPKKLSVYDLG